VDLGETLAVAVIGENAVLLAGPDGVVAHLAGSLHLEEQAAHLVRARAQALEKGRLLRGQLVEKALLTDDKPQQPLNITEGEVHREGLATTSATSSTQP
jgi:hypothetical protein